MQNDSNITLVIDIGNPAADGRLHDRAHLLSISHTLMPLYELVRSAEAARITCVTPEVFLRAPETFAGQRVLLLSWLTTDRTDALIEKGAEPFLLLCQESPFIATRFYLHFRAASKRFRYTMAFSGMERQAHSATTFLPMHFPIYIDPALKPSSQSFAERKNTVLVAGNKSARGLKTILLQLRYGRKVRLIYPFRKRAVDILAADHLLDIYGRGWETDPSPAIREAYRGPAAADAKHAILGTYRFTLCFENAIFPGYVTEKLFDALLAGSVPVYLGDPDIAAVVPKDAYIDMRDFKTLSDLRDFLATMDEERFLAYRARIDAYLRSASFALFTHTAFITTIHDLIRNHVR